MTYLQKVKIFAAMMFLLLWMQAGFAQNTPSSTSPTTPDASASSPNGSSATKQQDAAASNPSSAAPADASQPPEDNTNRSYKHDGSEDDIDAIGNRKMGNRGLGNWYSLEHEIALGKQYAQQVEASARMVQDPVVTEYVNRVGQNLVRNSDAKVPFTIKVIDDDSINAMALPGGFFYVNSGLILAADNESEMAGVMAHEIAHVAARHATRQMTRGNLVNIASLPLIFVGGGIGYAARSIASLAIPLGFLKFSRGFEAEADHLGIEYAYKAGYDPQGLVTMFEKTAALEKKKPGTLAKAFDTHPQTPDRISATEKEIATILPPRESYIVDTSEFEEVKARLAAIENRHKLDDSKDTNRPSLRRTVADNTQNGKDTKSDDDRPTLKRRDDNNNN
jgi:predicted Zn-dependent protease